MSKSSEIAVEGTGNPTLDQALQQMFNLLFSAHGENNAINTLVGKYSADGTFTPTKMTDNLGNTIESDGQE